MKKPDYCPEWFNIDLYDNLKDFSRDNLCLGLWVRKMNYHSFLMEEKRGGVEDKEQSKAYAIEWLATIATKWLEQPIPFKNSQTKENYNPLAVEEDIIQELNWRDIARIYTESYVEIPEIRQFFQETNPLLEECIAVKEQADPPNIHTEWLDASSIMPEDADKKDIKSLERLFYSSVSSKSNYANIFVIDLSQSDEILHMAFKEKLEKIRAEERKNLKKSIYGNGRTKRFSEAEIRKIIDYRVFAYIDLYTYGAMTGRKFTDVEMANMIYPPRNDTPLNFDAVDRITRTVKPKAIELLEQISHRLLL